ncbi:hypothetical protein BC940DRAFT_16369 [Gongronella butleri]|nr:hypothetical protein BC940DRAFT_16369 [Gongronella butleri]
MFFLRAVGRQGLGVLLLFGGVLVVVAVVIIGDGLVVLLAVLGRQGLVIVANATQHVVGIGLLRLLLVDRVSCRHRGGVQGSIGGFLRYRCRRRRLLLLARENVAKIANIHNPDLANGQVPIL